MSGMSPVSLHDLRRIAEALDALRGGSISGASMRSDLRLLRLEFADGTLAVVRIDADAEGRPRLEVDVVRRAATPASQLEVRFETA